MLKENQKNAQRLIEDKRSIVHNLKLARQSIESGWASVLVSKEKILDCEKGTGIEPALLILKRWMHNTSLDREQSRTDLVFGDKVLGLAAFRLGALIGVKAMWGLLVSQHAVTEGGIRGVYVSGDKVVPRILNRLGNDSCPMEKLACVSKTDVEFYEIALEKLGLVP